jgi:hypothetical protein
VYIKRLYGVMKKNIRSVVVDNNGRVHIGISTEGMKANLGNVVMKLTK